MSIVANAGNMITEEDEKKVKIDKIGMDRFVETLKKSNYKPVGIHNLGGFLASATSPNFKKKKQGKVTLVLPNEIFNNSEDLRQLNKGKYVFLILFVENTKPKTEEKKPC